MQEFNKPRAFWTQKVEGKKILINAVSSKIGGGLTYLKNLIRELERTGSRNQYIIYIPSGQAGKINSEKIKIRPVNYGEGSYLRRIWWEQIGIRKVIKKEEVDVLFSVGNFGLIFSPVKQILFSQNSVYFSKDYSQDLIKRKAYGEWLMNKLKEIWSLFSIFTADVNLVPTDAFGNQIKKHNKLVRKVNFLTLHQGFDKDYFRKDKIPLLKETLEKLKLRESYKRILLVSHYYYFRNFETFIRAILYLKKALPKEKIMIVLTVDIREGLKYGRYDTTYASKLIDKLNVRSDIAMLGFIPYSKLHHLYKLCDLSVSPAYAESFGHPMVEAMAMGLPVIAAKTPVHQEICQKSALYFDVFNEKDLAQKCVQLLTNKTLYQELKQKGLERYKDFSWKEYVEGLLEMIDELVKK